MNTSGSNGRNSRYIPAATPSGMSVAEAEARTITMGPVGRQSNDKSPADPQHDQRPAIGNEKNGRTTQPATQSGMSAVEAEARRITNNTANQPPPLPHSRAAALPQHLQRSVPDNIRNGGDKPTPTPSGMSAKEAEAKRITTKAAREPPPPPPFRPLTIPQHTQRPGPDNRQYERVIPSATPSGMSDVEAEAKKITSGTTGKLSSPHHPEAAALSNPEIREPLRPRQSPTTVRVIDVAQVPKIIQETLAGELGSTIEKYISTALGKLFSDLVNASIQDQQSDLITARDNLKDTASIVVNQITESERAYRKWAREKQKEQIQDIRNLHRQHLDEIDDRGFQFLKGVVDTLGKEHKADVQSLHHHYSNIIASLTRAHTSNLTSLKKEHMEDRRLMEENSMRDLRECVRLRDEDIQTKERLGSILRSTQRDLHALKKESAILPRIISEMSNVHGVIGKLDQRLTGVSTKVDQIETAVLLQDGTKLGESIRQISKEGRDLSQKIGTDQDQPVQRQLEKLERSLGITEDSSISSSLRSISETVGEISSRVGFEDNESLQRQMIYIRTAMAGVEKEIVSKEPGTLAEVIHQTKEKAEHLSSHDDIASLGEKVEAHQAIVNLANVFLTQHVEERSDSIKESVQRANDNIVENVVKGNAEIHQILSRNEEKMESFSTYKEMLPTRDDLQRASNDVLEKFTKENEEIKDAVDRAAAKVDVLPSREEMVAMEEDLKEHMDNCTASQIANSNLKSEFLTLHIEDRATFVKDSVESSNSTIIEKLKGMDSSLSTKILEISPRLEKSTTAAVDKLNLATTTIESSNSAVLEMLEDMDSSLSTEIAAITPRLEKSTTVVVDKLDMTMVAMYHFLFEKFESVESHCSDSRSAILSDNSTSKEQIISSINNAASFITLFVRDESNSLKEHISNESVICRKNTDDLRKDVSHQINATKDTIIDTIQTSTTGMLNQLTITNTVISNNVAISTDTVIQIMDSSLTRVTASVLEGVGANFLALSYDISEATTKSKTDITKHIDDSNIRTSFRTMCRFTSLFREVEKSLGDSISAKSFPILEQIYD
ncbi:hypothetical protein B0J14DRAFT_691290, partial [Halenospora varia]